MSDRKFYLLACAAMGALIVLAWVYGFILNSLGADEEIVGTYLAGVLTIALVSLVIYEGGKIK